ncbi:hypothetical protein VPKG_00066 [Vibrio phage pYD21-A]|uniref:hypothetical protein n=1 Tax=Vibrio phage pYD21-A TaxID=754049 RepID=UPI0002C13B41|nr:hypothetical protein VPKG_00066 [Vibrio phage pYD21-A]AGH16103.1 hypothetical protein VPKG_00066 [Vibrio phage pYD21-A]
MNLENTKVYTTDKEVIRKYGELCGVEIEPNPKPTIGYYFPISHHRICYFISDSCVDTDHEYIEVTDRQINALYDEKFGGKLDQLDAHLGVDVEWKNGDECKFKDVSYMFVSILSNEFHGTAVIYEPVTEMIMQVPVASLSKPETPQQREERERLEAIETMCNEVDKLPHGEAFAAMATLYDLGYRKQ